MKKDDFHLKIKQRREIEKNADLLLKKADAYGVFPTPIPSLIHAAELELAREQSLDSVFLGELYRHLPNSIKLAPDRLKKALEKVLGLLDRPARTIYLDESIHKNRRPFLSLHEVAHDFLSWQRRTYDLVEDGETTLNDETRDEFEREANCFASDVLFQLNSYTKDAADSAFGVLVPVKLAKRYGSSVYAAIRRYVVKSDQICATLVFEIPIAKDGSIDELVTRRAVASAPFEKYFGKSWMKKTYHRGEFFIEHLPRQRLTPPTPLRLTDKSGNIHDCTAEAFNSSRQVFYLIRSLRTR